MRSTRTGITHGVRQGVVPSGSERDFMQADSIRRRAGCHGKRSEWLAKPCALSTQYAQGQSAQTFQKQPATVKRCSQEESTSPTLS